MILREMKVDGIRWAIDWNDGDSYGIFAVNVDGDLSPDMTDVLETNVYWRIIQALQEEDREKGLDT